MTPTLWFLVTIFLSADGNHWTMRAGHTPMQVPSYKACMDEGVSKMVDRRNPKVKLYCVEADSAQDLHDILNKAFDFGGKPA